MTGFPAIRNVVVLGGGSAGFLAALTLRRRLPHLSVTLIRSTEIGVSGVGEGTTLAIPRHLFGYLRLDPAWFYALARPTWKLGLKFLWGPGPAFYYSFSSPLTRPHPELTRWPAFQCFEESSGADANMALMAEGRAFARQANGDPLIEDNVAFHIENDLFLVALESAAREHGVVVRDDTLVSVEGTPSRVDAIVLRASGRIEADLWVDSSGFAAELIGKHLREPFQSYASSLPCDRAVVGGWPRTSEPLLPYTVAETMNAGWCWQIEHEHRINRGYVFSSAHLSDEAATEEFLTRNPLPKSTRIIRFPSGRRARSWVGNVFAIGNAAGFVEPLEATALDVICGGMRALCEILRDCTCAPGPAAADAYNRMSSRVWDSIRRFLAIHYRFNTRLDTPFWKDARSAVDLAGAEPIVELFQQCGPIPLSQSAWIDQLDPFQAEGYYTLLIGQGVPARRPAEYPPLPEADYWRAWCARQRETARHGLTVPEALRSVRSPEWRWKQDFYKG